MLRQKPILFALAALVGAVPPVLAEETILEVISVEADAVAEPYGASVDEDSIRAQRPGTSDTASLLRDVPGVHVNAAGGVSGLPALRGLADDRLRIKVDGMDLIATCPNHMNPPLSYVDPSNVGELTVYAGISPVSVGGDSIGGTIEVETRAPQFSAAGESPRTGAELGAFYRSNNDAIGGNAALNHASESVSVSYNGSWSRADNYTAADDFKTSTATGRVGKPLPLDEVGSSAYETSNHTLGLAAKQGSNLFEFGAGIQNMPEQRYPNQRMDLVDNVQQRFNLGWTGVFQWGALETSAYQEDVEHSMDFGEDKRFWYGMQSQPPAAAEPGTPCAPPGFMTCAAGMPMVSESDTTGAKVAADVDMASGAVLGLGVEYQRYRLDDYWEPSGGGMWPGTFLNINDGERDRRAAYAEWRAMTGSGWHSVIGARYERVNTDAGDVRGYKTDLPAPGNQIADAAAFNSTDRSRQDDNWDVTALTRYQYSDALDIELGLARKERSPNLYERYTWSTWAMPAVMNNFTGDGNGYVGNVGLKPEVAHTASVTVDWHAPDRRWEMALSPFFTQVEDYIDAVPLDPATFQAGQFNVLQYVNQSARLYGMDLSASAALMRNDLGSWGVRGLVSYTRGKNRDTGDDLYNIMPLNGRLSLTHTLGGWDNALEWELVDNKDKVSEVRNEIETAGYGLLHLRASHAWDSVRMDVGVENLLDRFYFLPTGGTYVGQGSTMAINGIPWGIAVPGMGRSVYAGVTVTF